MKKTNIDFMKNFAKKNFIKLFSSIVLLLIVVFALSCDIGLGAAIDTEAPTATITYPPEGAVIRDWFVLAGTCEDDDAVEKVEVSISSSYYSTTRNAVIENKTSWRLKLNDGTNGAYNGWEFPDGDYTANVTVYDASGRSTGPYSRSFKIDNTAPIFIISSPGSTDVSSQNTFGTTINVSGTVAESNGVSKVAIAVLGDGLSEPKVLEQYNIDTSDGASIDFARFNKAEPESLESVNYKAIYGEVTVTNGVITDSNSTKNFKTTVTVSDKAYKYQSPSSGTATEKNGNTTSNVYLYDDVYQAILGESGLGLTPGELIRSVNGVLKTDSALNAKEILNNNKKDSVETSLCFALDPKARPTYSVTSLETLDKTKLSAVNAVKDDSEQLKEKAKEAISSRTISGSVITANVNVFAGSSALIETNSLKMWIHQLTKDEYVEDTLTALISNLENSVYGSSSSSGNNDSPTGWTQIAQGSGENSASVVLNSDPLANILSNEFYLVAVTGKDSSGTYLDQGTVFYALMGQPSSAMPVISLTSPEDGKYYTQSAESNLTISGSASSEENKIKSVSVSVKYTEDTEGENKQSNTQPFSGENLANSKDFTFNLSNFTNLGSVADSNNYGYTIEVEVVDTDNNKSNETRKIYIDKKAPEISLPVAEPIVASYTPENSCSQEGSYINGIFTLEVNVKESRLKELKYQIVNSENSEVLSLYDESGTKLDLTDNWYVLGTSSAYTLKTDTTKYDNDKKIKFNFKATDEAGNETQLSSDAYTIQQETDRPIITVTNADASKTSASHDLSSVSAENGQNNLFDLNTKKEIQFMVEDDDYLHNVSVTVKNINTNKSYTLTPTAALPADKTTSYSAKYSLDSALKDSSGKPVEGVYLVIITAEDATYSLASSDEVKKNRKSEAKFYIAVDTANPLLTESGIGNNVKSTNLASPISLSGSASDTNALYASDETTSGKGAISISVCKSGEENPVKVYTTDVSCSTNANSGTWSQKITKEDLTQSGSYDGSYEITITLKDAAGKTKSLVRNLLVDSVAPVFSSGPEITSSKNGSWYNTDSLAISAIVTDNKSVNSVQYAKYTGDWSSENIASGTPPASLDSEGWKNLVLTSSNIYTGTVSLVKSASTKIAILAKDAAGNVTYKNINAVNIDTAEPIIDSSKTKVELVGVENSIVTAPVSVLSNKENDAKITVSLSDLGSSAGESSQASGINKEKIFVSVGTRFSSSQIEDSYKATVTEGSGDEAGTYSFTLAKNKISNGTVYLRFYDNAGNYSDSSLFTFNVDTTKPIVAVSSPRSSTVNGKLSVSGTVKETYPDTLKVYALTSEPTGNASTDFAEKTPLLTQNHSENSVFSWSIEDSVCDFNILSSVQDRNNPKELWIVPLVSDKAGWTNEYKDQAKKYTVDLNSDRPVISLATLTSSGQTLMYADNASISGSVSDDDATASYVVKKFIASSESINTDSSVSEEVDSSTGTYTYKIARTVNGETKYDITTFTPTSGDWTFQPANTSDGEKNVYFYIKDMDEGVFYTDSTNASDPYILYKEASSKVDNTSALAYKSDSSSPTFGNFVLERSSNGSIWNDEDKVLDVDKDTITGGKGRYIRFVLDASDISGIESMSLVLSDQEGNNLKTLTTESLVEGASFNAASGSSEKYIWTTEKIDTVDLKSEGSTTSYDGKISAILTVKDKSGLEATNPYMFAVDNKSPLVSSVSPNTQVEVTGSLTITGVAKDEGEAGLNFLKWMIPLKANTGTSSTVADSVLAEIEDSSSSESSSFTDGKWHSISGTSTFTVNIEEAIAQKFTNYDGNTGTTTFGSATSDSKVYFVPFYIYVEDNAGNYSIERHSIRYNPDGATPRVQTTYPTTSDYDKDSSGNLLDYVTLGGLIRVQGISEDNIGTSAVFVQLNVVDSSDNDNNAWNGSFTEEDKTYLTSKGYTIVTKSDLTSTYNLESSAVPDDWWGIKATGNSTWTINLNQSGELKASGSAASRWVQLRACSVDNDKSAGRSNENHLSAWCEPVNIKVDDKAPKIGNILQEVVRFADDVTPVLSDATKNSGVTVTGIQDAKTSYSQGMFLRGSWYLGVSVEDESALNSVTVTGSGVKNNNISAISPSPISVDYKDSSVLKTKYLYIPISTDFEQVTYTITAVDMDSPVHTSSLEYSFKIDNTAPVLKTLKDSASTDLLSISSEDKASVANSNYKYTMTGSATDDVTGSGIDYIAFYYKRDYSDESEKSRIFDVAKQNTQKSDGIEIDSSSEISITQAVTQGSTTSSETYTLYGASLTGTVADESSGGSVLYSFSSEGISGNEHIRQGGLIYIDGLFRIITSKSGDKVFFESAASIGFSVTAKFPYAQVINQTESTNLDSSTHRYSASTVGDCDGIIEKFTGNDYERVFSVDFHSQDIPDGPAKLSILVFDKAGNVTGNDIDVVIQNNAPRLAKLYLGTDLNGDGYYDSSEFNEYLAAGVNTYDDSKADTYVETFDINSSDSSFGYGKAFKVTKGLALIPEYTGGNGSLHLVVNMNTTDETLTPTKKSTSGVEILRSADTSENITADFSFKKLKNNMSGTANYGISNSLEKFLINSGTSVLGTDGSKSVSFTFWDETDGTTVGTDSNNFVVRVKDLNIDQTDVVNPNVFINKFHWNSLNDNSVYGTETLTDIKKIQGHIELENDWTAKDDSGKTLTGWNEKEAATENGGEFDGDPKVSGKIVFRGTAYDDQRLDKISVTFPGFKFTNAFSGGTDAGELAVLAKFNPTSSGNTWLYVTGEGSKASMESDGWEFNVYDEKSNLGKKNGAFFGQKGHMVYWELAIDTAKITDVAASDVTVEVIATDHNEKVSPSQRASSVTSLDDAETVNNSQYRVDIVPYITSLTTSLSVKKNANPSVYARSSVGHYPVYAMGKQNTLPESAYTSSNKTGFETIIVNGFNLKAGSDNVKFYADSAVSGTTTATANLTSSENSLIFTVPKAAKSGNISVTVNEMESLNNRNYNNSRGTYEDETFASSLSNSDLDTVAENLDFVGGDNDTYINFYNRQPNGANNNILTDDVYIDIWQFNSEAALADSYAKADNPVMKINPSNNMIGFAFSNGGMKFSMGDASNSYKQWNASYDYMQYNEFAYDSTGASYGTSVGGDISSSTNDFFSFMTSRWSEVGDGQGANYGTNNHLRLEAIGTSSSTRKKDRIQSPSIATFRRNSDNNYGTDIFIAYYDLLNNQLKFKSGWLQDSKGRNHFGNFYDFGMFANSVSNYTDSDNYTQIVADGTDSTLGTANLYVSIGVTSDEKVVMVWYDGENLQYAYNTSPENTSNSSDFNAGKNKTNWTGPFKLDSNSGANCKLAVDKNNGIHIAAYTGSKLKYYYIKDYTKPSEVVPCVVDSYSGVGDNLTIDVASETIESTTYYIPHIGYWGNYPTLPRYATLAKPEKFFASSEAVCSGVSSNYYTGIWNCSIVPTQSKAKKNTVNVAVWKFNGALTNSTTGTSQASTSSGKCYGNGTSNAVLGYVVAPSSSQYNIETAQKR